MRARGALLFVVGFVAGALVFYSVAWRTGALAPGHWLSRTSHDLSSSAGASSEQTGSERPGSERKSPATSAAPPLRTIPFPTPTDLAAAASAPAQPLAVPMETPRPASPLAGALAISDMGRLLLPVHGARLAALKDNFSEMRGSGSRPHEAIDILAPRGTPVLAAATGTVVKLFTSQQGGLTVYQFDPTGTWAYYYAHLDRYAPGLAEGMTLSRGDRVGDVGSTGNASADAPHLHFAIFRLGPEKHWWKGEPVNPFPLLLKAEER
ncbi:MAG: M23 family metallopeptidase [Acidobacteriota bacterium]